MRSIMNNEKKMNQQALAIHLRFVLELFNRKKQLKKKRETIDSFLRWKWWYNSIRIFHKQ